MESPADESGVRALEEVLAVQDQLFRHEHCGISTCGWSANFTVICERDAVLERVKMLLAGVGCSISAEHRYVSSEEPFHGRQTSHQLDPVGAGVWEEVPREQEVIHTEPVIVQWGAAA